MHTADSLQLRRDVPLRDLTTLKVGGMAQYVIEIHNDSEVEAAVRFSKENALPFFVLGGGSNVLGRDEGYAGVIMLMKSTGYQVVAKTTSSVTVTIAAGELLDDFIRDSVREGWWGLENLSHIPGTVGATPIQNVGAYGMEVGQRIISVDVYDTETHAVITLSHHECHFAYRDSIFKSAREKKYIILRVTMQLSLVPLRIISYADLARVFPLDSEPSQQEIRDAIISIRSTKFPDWHVVGTAGSFFKNPIITKEIAESLKQQYPELPMYSEGETHTKVSLGYILDKICHLKGTGSAHVRLYEAQALVLVTEAGATVAEVETFARDVQEKVFSAVQIAIESEVTRL